VIHGGSDQAVANPLGFETLLPYQIEKATFAAGQSNPVIRQFYERLRTAGKAHKVALVACMRKPLTILNAMMKHRTRWQELSAQRA